MSDGTELPPGGGGDTIATVVLDAGANPAFPSGTKVGVGSLVTLDQLATGATATNVSDANPLPVGVQGSVAITSADLDVALSTRASETTLAALNAKVAVCNTAAVVVTTLPAITFAVPQHVVVDSASLGTVAVSNAGLSNLDVALSTVATDTHLTAMSAKLPASVGAKTGAGSFSVVPASDGFAVTIAAGAAVIGHVVTDSGSTTAVTGDVAVTNAGLSNIDVASSTLAKDAHITDGSLRGTVALSAGAAAIGSVGVTSLPALPAGGNVIGHVIADSGSTTAVTGNVAVTNAGLSNIDVALSTRALETGGNLATIATNTGRIPAQGQALAAASTPVVLTAIQVAQLAQDAHLTDGSLRGTVALSAGAAVIGHVIADSGSTTAVTSLPAIPTGANTIGAVTGPSAAALALDATLTSGSQIAIAKGAAATGAAVSGNPVYVGGKDASGNTQPIAIGVATIALSQAVNPATSSTWDVSDRAARLIGALTGADGATIASATNALPVLFGRGTTTQIAALATAGQVIKASAGIIIGFELTQSTGGAIFIQIFDRTTTGPGAGATPLWWSISIASAAVGVFTGCGSSTFGTSCATGICIVASSTQATYTAIASTAVTFAQVLWY